MSFFRPRFPDRPLRPEDFEATFRLRGLKGFQPHHVVGFQDPLFTDEPQFWILDGDLAGAAGFFGHIGVQTPDIKDLICSVDGFHVGGTNAEQYTVDGVQGEGAVLAVMATDSQVHLLNRRDQGPNAGFPQRVGLLRIADATNATVGQARIASVTSPANTTYTVNLRGWRLYKNEQLWVRNTSPNVSIRCTMWGRLMKRT